MVKLLQTDLSTLEGRTGVPCPVLSAIIRSGEAYAQRVVLYGSRARGDHRPRSDMDIAFFGGDDAFLAFQEEMERLPTLLEMDVVHITPRTSEALAQNIRKDGILLTDKSSRKTDQLCNAVKRLHEGIREYQTNRSEVVRDGVIQRFEFCVELAWKAVQDVLEAQGYLDVHGPKPVMRKAYAQGLITDEHAWLELLNVRNQTSHLYDDQIANAVYQDIERTYTPCWPIPPQRLST